MASQPYVKMASTRHSWQYNDAGILRKKEEEEELLVFGYSCKLFRDDEKALFIDQGKHLIPWMGDESLKIDRYDGRGALYDLKQCEALPGGHDENRWVGLSESERRVEQLCDEERYRALHHNEEEEALYQEEELKRLHKALGANDYGQVAFNYDEPNGKVEEKGEGEQTEEEEGGDEAFIPPPELDIPVNMVLPETVKLNAIILKTALFISQQGAQMEILLKMKQANNPQFQFLSFDSPLHPYYRHLLMAIKTGRYHPPSEKKVKEECAEDAADDHYLHPSLAPTGSRLELAPSIPSINYKPSADCAYSMLVNKIKDKQAAFSFRPSVMTDQQPLPAVYYPEQQQMVTATPTTVATVPEPSPIIAAPPVRYDHKSENSTEPPQAYNKTTPAVPVVSTKNRVQSKGKLLPHTVQPQQEKDEEEETPMKPEAASCISSCSSRSVSPPIVQPASLVVPPTDMQIIVDKMASYVAKNGQDFEAIVRSKGDQRFAFLDSGHPFHAYYRHKITVYEKLEETAMNMEKTNEQQGGTECAQDTVGEDSQDAMHKSPDSQRSAEDGKDDGRSRSKPAPVCFSIKKPKEAECLLLEKRSALPVEESSDEEEGQETLDKNRVEEKKKSMLIPAEKCTEAEKEEPPTRESAELIDLTDDHVVTVEETNKEKKVVDKAKWEERVKDKLAAAAREKLAAAAREKQLQLERKRRAAAFLTMIQKEHPMQTPAPPIIGPQLPDGGPVLRVSPDNDDVSSIPSPNSSDMPSPPQILSQEVDDRLSPKQNGDTKSSSSLFARIQASNQGIKRRSTNRSSSSESSTHSRNKSNSGKHRHKHKRKKSSAHHRDRSLSPSPHSRSHRSKRDESHSKSKKLKRKEESRKTDSRSRSRSHSTLRHRRSSQHQHQSHQHHHHHHHDRHSVHTSTSSDSRRERHKKKKKSSKHKSSSSSSVAAAATAGHSSDSV